MKVRITLTVEVDRKQWALEYGIDESEVRDDVALYVRQHVEDLYAVRLMAVKA